MPRHAVEGRDGGGARLVDRRTEAHRERGGDDPSWVADRPVDDHRCRQLAVRDEDAARVVGDERRVEEVHLLDEARLVGDGDAVADPQRLREGDEHPRAEVRERRVEGEADEEREHGARREQRVHELVGARVEGEDLPDRDCRDERDHDLAQEAQRRPAARCECRILRRQPPLVPADRDPEQHAHRDHDGEADAGRDQRLDGAIAHAVRFGAHCREPASIESPRQLRPRQRAPSGICPRRRWGSKR